MKQTGVAYYYCPQGDLIVAVYVGDDQEIVMCPTCLGRHSTHTEAQALRLQKRVRAVRGQLAAWKTWTGEAQQ